MDDFTYKILHIFNDCSIKNGRKCGTFNMKRENIGICQNI